MATRKQKQELMDALKFTPQTVRLMIQGYGGEAYAGTVPRPTYEYFKSKKIDIEQYATDWDDLFSDVPDEHRPFSPGSPYDCDNLWHASGAELSSSNEVTLDDEKGNTIWSSNLEYDDLSDAGVSVGETGGAELADLDQGTVVFWGGQGEKGCFFDAEFTLRAPFDPSKLRIGYENCDGWYLITSVEYDGEELDGCGGYSTTGKWAEHKWVIVGDTEEIYEAQERSQDDDDEEQDEVNEEWDPVAELDSISVPYTVTEWFDKDVQPYHKGEYEVMIDAPWPLGGQGMAEWTGRTWKQDGKKVAIHQWRGITEKLN